MQSVLITTDVVSVNLNNYLCNWCLSPLMLWVRLQRTRCTTLCDKVCQWLATGPMFSPGPAILFHQ